MHKNKDVIIYQFLKNFMDETIFGFMNNDVKKFSEKEQKLLKIVISAFSQLFPNKAQIFDQINMENVQFYWKNVSESGVLGSFQILFPNRIYVPKFSDENYKYEFTKINDVCSAFPTMMHELVHMSQFGINTKFPLYYKIFGPILYVFNCFFCNIIDNFLVKKLNRNKLINDEDFHINFLYKLTLEYDAEINGNKMPEVIEFCKNLDFAISAIQFLRNYKNKNYEFYESVKNQYEHEIPEEYMFLANELFDAL